MALTKKQRQFVWDKTEGHCSYCGDELPVKGWHSDHVIPVVRNSDGTMMNPEADVIENIVPACSICNNYKHSMSLEDFRWSLRQQVKRARKYSVNFRLAEKFKQVAVVDEPITFYFERNGAKYKVGDRVTLAVQSGYVYAMLYDLTDKVFTIAGVHKNTERGTAYTFTELVPNHKYFSGFEVPESLLKLHIEGDTNV